MAEKISIYSNHSYAACIGEGFRFLAKHLALISKIMLPYYTVLSVITVLSSAINTKLNVAMIAGDKIDIEEVFAAIGIFLILYLFGIICNGRLFLMIRRLTGAEITMPEDMQAQVFATKSAAWKMTMKRTMQLAYKSLPYTIWGLPLVYLDNVIEKYAKMPEMTVSNIFIVVVIAIVSIIAVIFALPLIYTYYCRMMKPTYMDMTTEEGRRQAEAFDFKKAYKKALHFKGKIFGVSFLSSFLIVVLSVVLIFPVIISTDAYLASIEGKVNFDDTVLIPGTGYFFMLLVSTVSFTLCNILAVSLYASLLYLHGDIYSAEKHN